MRLLIVSDLHIRGQDDPLLQSVLALLRDRAEAGDVVVFAGDVFDLFVGNKSIFMRRYSRFFEELAAAARRGVKIHYIEGNHDFLIRKAFAGIPEVSIHSHDFGIEMGGKRFFFAHGDLVDKSDYSYRALRTFFRSPVMKALVAVLPGALLDRIGQMSSSHSRNRKPLLPSDLPIQRMEPLRRAYRSYAAERLAEGYDFVVMGHCHDLDEMQFQVNGRRGQYVNVGYPRAHGSFLSWSSGDEKIQRERLP